MFFDFSVTGSRLDGGVKRQIITPASCADADAGVGGKEARSLRVGGEVPAHQATDVMGE